MSIRHDLVDDPAVGYQQVFDHLFQFLRSMSQRGADANQIRSLSAAELNHTISKTT